MNLSNLISRIKEGIMQTSGETQTKHAQQNAEIERSHFTQLMQDDSLFNEKTAFTDTLEFVNQRSTTTEKYINRINIFVE